MKNKRKTETERRISKYKDVLGQKAAIEHILDGFIKLKEKAKHSKNEELIVKERKGLKEKLKLLKTELKIEDKIDELNVDEIHNLQEDIDKRLLKLNINSQIQRDKTLLHIKTMENSIDEVKLLIDNHELVNLDIKDKNGDTALHIACNQLNEEVIKELIENGANLNIRNKDGDTALNVLLKKYKGSCDDKVNDLAKLLINKGANYLMTNNENNSALDIVLRSKNKIIEKLILDKEAMKQQELNNEILNYIDDINLKNQDDININKTAIEKFVRIKTGVNITKDGKITAEDIDDITKLYMDTRNNNKITVEQKEELTQKEMDKIIKSEPVYVRGLQGLSGVIKDFGSHKDTLKMKYIETGCETEARKLIRRYSDRTLTKIQGTKEGNPNRCFTMINFGRLEPFVTVGYGVTNIDVDKIKFVAKKDAWSKVNKEEGIIEVYDKEVKDDIDNLSIDVEVKNVFNNLRDRKNQEITKQEVGKSKKIKGKNPMKLMDTKEHNELIIDVNENDVSFIYYFNWNKTYNESYNKLQALYFRKVYQEKTGRLLPIFEYRMNKKRCFKLQEIKENEIAGLIKEEMLKNTTHGKVLKDEYKNIKAADFWIVLKDEIKKVDKDNSMINEYLEEQKDKQLDIYDVINLYRVKKVFQGEKELRNEATQKEFVEKIKPFLQTEDMLTFLEARTIKGSYKNKRLNRKIDFWLNIVSQIYELSTNETKKELSESIEQMTNEIYEKNREEDAEKKYEATLNKSLYYAVDDGDVDIAKELIRYGADVNYLHDDKLKKQDEVKEPLIIDAIMKNDREMVRLLIRNNANIDVKSKNGKTVREIAIKMNNNDILEMLDNKKKDGAVILKRINEEKIEIKLPERG